MKKIIPYLLFSCIVFTSCETYDEFVIELTGLYEANILGISGPHTISIAYDRGDNIVIEAPFDGFVWTQAYADVDDQEERLKYIDIDDQEIGPGIIMYGEGTYLDGVLELDYAIDFGNEIVVYTLIGQHYP